MEEFDAAWYVDLGTRAYEGMGRPHAPLAERLTLGWVIATFYVGPKEPTV